jgi:CubicO group peptidase (beta-lactamase class C family)
MYKKLILLLCLAFSAPATAAAWNDPNAQKQLLADLEKIRQTHDVAGAAIAVVDTSNVVLTHGFGVSSRQSQQPVSPQTPFRVGSISKSLTALAAMMLVQDGKLRLSDKLRDLAPEVPLENPWEATDPITVAMLLEHTAGLDDVPYSDYLSGTPNSDVAQYATKPSKINRAHWRPGEKFRYANPGPAIVGYLIQKISGQSFDDFLEQRVLRPIGMTNASFRSDNPALSLSYQPGSSTPEPYWHMSIRPTGALHASAEEMAALVQFLLLEGEVQGKRLLQPDLARRMERSETSPVGQAGLQTAFGLGRFVFARDGTFFTGHWGKVDGFIASYGYRKALGRGFVLMLNTASEPARSQMLDRLARFVNAGAAKPTAPKPVAGGLDGLSGGYFAESTPDRELARLPLALVGTLELDVQSDRVQVAGGFGREPTTLLAVGQGRLQSQDLPLPTALLTADLYSEAGGSSYTRISALQFWGTRAIVLGFGLVLLVSVLYLPFWAVPALLGRIRPVAVLARGMPLLTGALLVLVLYVVIVLGLFAGDEANLRLTGTASWRSVLVYLASLIAPVMALLGLGLALRLGWRVGQRWALVYGVVSSLLLLLFCGLLAAYGWIGLQTWVA